MEPKTARKEGMAGGASATQTVGGSQGSQPIDLKEESEMGKELTRMSRLLGVSGVASIVFGVTVLLWPGISLLSLTLLFGAFAFVYGTFAIGAGLYLVSQRSTEWVPYLVGGVAGVIIGVITYLHPGITDLTLVFLVAGWAFVIGVFEIVAAIDMWSAIPGARWLAAAGALSVVFAIIVAFRPAAGMLAILWVIGFYGILAGVTRLVAAYRVHQFQGDVKSVAGAMQPSRA